METEGEQQAERGADPRPSPGERTLLLSPREERERMSSKLSSPVSSLHRPQNVPPPMLVPGATGGRMGRAAAEGDGVTAEAAAWGADGQRDAAGAAPPLVLLRT